MEPYQFDPTKSEADNSFDRYKAKVAEWEKAYGKPPKVDDRAFDPTQLTLACVGCREIKGRMTRHHVAHDYLFALLMPDLYAYRYLEFHKEDVVWMCEKCHGNVHGYYAPIVQEMWQEYTIQGCTEEFCEKYKEKIRAAFRRWVKSREVGKPRHDRKRSDRVPNARKRRRGRTGKRHKRPPNNDEES